MHYYVVGVNATGKTSLLKAAAERTGAMYIHGTGELMKHLGIPGDYTALRNLDQSYVLEQWEETARDLVREYSERSFYLDIHIMNLTHGQMIRRDGPWIQEYDAMVLVTAPVEQILERIEQDNGRDRAMFGEGLERSAKLRLLGRYQQETKKLFQQLVADYHIHGFELENVSGQFAGAVEQLVSLTT